ncbi:MAG: hypothetical protein KA715_03700 [Xanthomonadaceae bacterium]|nr:hypothetical protein [Xanthomonadaceae bacterium]
MKKLGWYSNALLMGSMMITGCENPPSSIYVGNTAIDVNLPSSSSAHNAVCDPFDSTEVGLPENKIWGRIYSWDPWWNPETNSSSSTPRAGPKNVAGYISEGVMLDVELYLNQLNVPTRPFDQGFSTQDALILKTPRGDTLYEYFALQMEANIKIGSSDTAGYYQFALITDDGSVMQMDDNGVFRNIVNNDGNHPTKMACASEAVYFDSNTRLPVKINYYQGPRYHIAMMLMWRKVVDASAASLVESQCGKSGNSFFFNSNVSPPVPSANYTGLIGRGWKVLSTDNFLLPAEHSDPTPCTQSCFSDNYQAPNWNTFVLSKQNVDTASIKVFVGGSQLSSSEFIYDPTLNAVFVPGFRSGDVKIDFCVIPVGGGGGIGV